MSRSILVAAALAASLLAVAVMGSTAAQATSYDAVGGFGQTSPVFSYGGGSVGGGFVALPNYAADNCVNTAGLACHNDVTGAYTFPAIGKNTTAGTLNFYTNVVPVGLLFVQSLAGNQAILRFTAPTTKTYTITGSFTRIDSSNGSGDGVEAGYYSVAGGTVSQTLANSLAGAPASYTFAFSNAFALTAGATVDFFLDARGNTNNDGTGLALTVTAVPEPATWMLMLAGFGLVGTGLRRRTTVVAA